MVLRAYPREGEVHRSRKYGVELIKGSSRDGVMGMT